MAYSLQTKKEVVEKIQQGMKIGKVAAMYGVSRQSIINWTRSPEKYLSETRQAHTPFDLEEKVRILRMMELSGLTARQVAELKNLRLHTILGWVKDKDRLFAVYSSQGQVPVNTGITISPGEEVPSVSTPDDKDTKQHIRGLKEENEYLKVPARVNQAMKVINNEQEPEADLSECCMKPYGCAFWDYCKQKHAVPMPSVFDVYGGKGRGGFTFKKKLDCYHQGEEDHGSSIGYRPMTSLVSKEYGKRVNRKRVRRLMQENDLLSAVRRRKWSDEVYAKRREMKANVPADLIKRDFFAFMPRRRMLEDITYLPGLEKTMYLNTIVDLYNGEILAHCISDSPNAKLCTDTIETLCTAWGECFRGAIIHNDLGSSYISYEYRAVLEAHGIIQSIGRVATCYDNAPMESLNGIIKTEALYSRFGKTKVKEKRVPIAEILNAVTDYISYYNNDRPKAYNGGLSPVQFRLQNPKGTYLVPINSKST